MSKYFFDYTDTVIGAQPAAHTIRGGGAPTFQPQYGVAAFKKRYLKLAPEAVANRMVTVDAVDGDALRYDFDILSCFDRDSLLGNWQAIIARATGTASLTCYAALVSGTSNGVQLIKIVANTITLLSAPAFTYVAGKQYFFRFSGIGTLLRFKVWASDSVEPTTWNISLTDSSITGLGAVGYAFSPTAAAQSANFNFLSVGTGTDIAQRPVTNAEYTIWLSTQNVQREVLTEFTATGYDSAGSAPFLKTRNVYLSRGMGATAFVSKPWDNPPNRAYPALIKSVPTFSQKMPTGLTGEAVTGFGDLVLDNSNGIPGKGAGELALDSWLRVRWNRSFIRLYLGDPSWPRHDFRPVIVGRIGRPTTPSATTLSFKIQNLSSAFNVPLTSAKFTTGQFIGAYKPVLIGSFVGKYSTSQQIFTGALFEPPMSDKIGLVFTLNDGPITITDGESFNPTVFDNLKFIGTQPGLTLNTVNTTTGLLTVPSHGMVLNYRVRFSSAAAPPPAGFVVNTNYFVISSGLTINDFKLSATPGGAAIIPTTSATSALVDGFGYSFDTTAGTMTLVTPPVGRVALSYVKQTDVSNYDNLFRRSGLSLDFKDQASFTAINSTPYVNGALFYQPGSTTLNQAFADQAAGTQSWYSITPDGLVRAGNVSLPTSTPVMTLTAGDFQIRTLKMVDEIPAIDFSRAQITYGKWFLAAGAFQSTDARATQGKSYAVQADYSFSGDIPIDGRPDRTDSDTTTLFELISEDGGRASQLRDLFIKRLGIFEVPVRLRALELSIGDTISLSDDRLGFRLWNSTNIPSPDNVLTGIIDSRLCVVIGIDVNLNGGAFPVTLTLMRQVPGYYPAGDLT